MTLGVVVEFYGGQLLLVVEMSRWRFSRKAIGGWLVGKWCCCLLIWVMVTCRESGRLLLSNSLYVGQKCKSLRISHGPGRVRDSKKM